MTHRGNHPGTLHMTHLVDSVRTDTDPFGTHRTLHGTLTDPPGPTWTHLDPPGLTGTHWGPICGTSGTHQDPL
jgi:hypothetical protein